MLLVRPGPRIGVASRFANSNLCPISPTACNAATLGIQMVTLHCRVDSLLDCSAVALRCVALLCAPPPPTSRIPMHPMQHSAPAACGLPIHQRTTLMTLYPSLQSLNWPMSGARELRTAKGYSGEERDWGPGKFSGTSPRHLSQPAIAGTSWLGLGRPPAPARWIPPRCCCWQPGRSVLVWFGLFFSFADFAHHACQGRWAVRLPRTTRGAPAVVRPRQGFFVFDQGD